LLCLAGAVVFACTGPDVEREKEAEGAYYLVYRDHEDAIERLPDALTGYRELAQKYAGTRAASKAQDRIVQLERAGELMARVDSVSQDSLKDFYRGVLRAAPGYTPAVRKLGTIYYNSTRLVGLSAASMNSKAMADKALGTWQQQDSLWSDYVFRPTPDDRRWQDNLCKQATGVARMLESFRRYREALEVVNRGLHYGAGDDVTSNTKVFASFYSFRAGRYEEAIGLAREALDYEHLSSNSQGRAYHVIGLCLFQIFDRTKDVADLDAAIEALNASVNADSSMTEARKMLKTLRQHRQRLAS